MENSQIPHIAETTIYDGSFATPVLEDITHGQRKNSRLFHTREENALKCISTIIIIHRTQK